MEKHTNHVPLVFKGEPYMIQGKISGVICGIVGGMGKYFLQINESYYQKLFEAGLTALVCGVLGAAGKSGFDYLRKKYFKRNNHEKFHQRNSHR